jgi:hypothetical protein
MNLDFIRKVGPAAVLAVVAGLLVATGGAAASPQGSASAAACTASKNVEVIEDVSGSMNATDPTNFRAKLMSAYLGIGGNQGKTLGAVTFSTSASVLFAPQPINAGTKPTMEALFTGVTDSGTTNYDAGFQAGAASNPNATSRIFLSDGAPTTFTNTHLSPKVKTYVVGLGVGGDSSAVATLTQIASETGGPLPFFVEDASALQPVAGAVTAGQNCKKLLSFTDLFSNVGQGRTHKAKAKSRVMDILTSWPNIGSTLKLGVGLPGASASVASAAKVKVQSSKGSNFASIRIKGLKKGQKVKIKIKAKALAGPTTATTQVIR